MARSANSLSLAVRRLGWTPRAIGSRWARRASPPSAVAACLLAAIVLVAIVPRLAARYDPAQIDPDAVLAAPSARHPFGTDEFGRDILSRVAFGARTSLGYAVLATTISVALGTLVGVTAGFFGGRFDAVAMRGVDVLMAFPGILLALIVITLLGPGLTNAMLAVGLGQAPGFSRVVRSTTLDVKSVQYVEAARATGATAFGVVWRHIMPNIRHVIFVLATLSYGTAILIGASLSFLGLGAQPPAAEWGSMLETARGYLQTNWWVGVLPGVVLGATLLCINVVADQLRDILDPSLRVD
jgi:peptide/nickel transport system permease protein